MQASKAPVQFSLLLERAAVHDGWQHFVIETAWMGWTKQLSWQKGAILKRPLFCIFTSN